MRLIDADKLIEICDKGWRLGSAINTKIYHTVDASDIRRQPTVKAITIEWIEKYIDNRLVKHGDTWTFINCMINDWEKENEASSSLTVSLVSGSVKFSDNVTTTQINNDISHGNVTAISSVKPDPNLKLVGNKEE